MTDAELVEIRQLVAAYRKAETTWYRHELLTRKSDLVAKALEVFLGDNGPSLDDSFLYD